jgi:DNA polymerase III epsilon subunit-like protein
MQKTNNDNNLRPSKPEKYISVDVETSGPIPGEFSMLSIGACVVGETYKSFYVELKPLNGNFTNRAIEVSGLSIKELKEKGTEPKEAMRKFKEWIEKVSGDARPVFVGFNATFDWMFCHWYFMKFLDKDPFGVSGLDIKAYYMGMKNCNWSETIKKKIRSEFPSKRKHTHNALDDAIEQAEIFEEILKKRKSKEMTNF